MDPKYIQYVEGALQALLLILSYYSSLGTALRFQDFFSLNAGWLVPLHCTYEH